MKKSLHLILCSFYFYSSFAQPPVQAKAQRSLQSVAMGPASVTRAGSNLDILYHRCTWRVNPDSAKGIKGAVFTRFTATAANVTSVTFDMSSVLVVDSVRYRTTKLPATNISRSGNIITITPGFTLTKNVVDSLTIFYRGVPPNPTGASIGYVKSSTTAAGNFIYTVSQPYEDKDWWPCKSDMTDKIDSIDIIVNTPSAFKVASNGKLVSSVTSGSNTTYYWSHRHPIPSYLVCLGVAKYTVLNSGTVNISGTNVPVFHYVFQRSNYATLQSTLDLCKPMLSSFSDKLGDYPYKDEKYGHYEHQSNAGGMEHATFSGMSASALSDWSVIAHELGHQWFGNKVTCATWNHIWLNEGFAQFTETLAAELVPSLNSNLPSLRSSIKSGARSITTLSPYLPNVTTTNDVFGSNTGRYYQRGAVVISMLRALLGDSLFFQGVRNYLDDPQLAYQSAITDDLRHHLENVSGLDLSEFFNNWIFGSGNPDYTVQWVNENKKIHISLVQRRSAGASVSYFHMPVVLSIRGAAKDTTVVVFDEGSKLSYAGGNFAASSSPSMISYQLSFVPVSIAFDPNNVTMATGTSGIFITLSESIKEFGAVKSDQGVRLQLLLDKNVSPSKVLVEKGTDGIHFAEVAEMSRQSAATVNVYTATDGAPFSGRMFYRAKLFAPNGEFSYSNTILQEREEKMTLSLYPDAANRRLVVSGWKQSLPAVVHVSVINLQGQKLIDQKRNISGLTLYVDVDQLKPGIYILQVNDPSNRFVMTEKFVVRN